MAGFEQTIIIGNVGRDPESRFLQNGSQVTDFSVAVTTRWNDSQSGEKREKVNWYKVSAWGKRAEVAKTYVRKGMQIMVKGTVTANAYMGSDGEPRASLDLRADDFQFLGGRADSQSSGGSEYDEVSGRDVDNIPF